MHSFLSEHSIELLMIPKLVNHLSEYYNKIIPIFYWANREGGILNNKILKNKEFRIIAVYARRPKFRKPDDDYFILKINEQLVAKNNVLKNFQVPSFAGIPLINSLEAFDNTAEFLWFNIDMFSGQSEIIIPLYLPDFSYTNLYGCINHQSMIEMIEEKSKPIQWAKAVEIFKEANRVEVRNTFFWTGYKPVYLLIPADQ
jgi:hypothetical protein